MRFLARPQDAARRPGEACAWIVRRSAAAAERAAAPPTREDLADAAQARAADGGAGRLWRRRLLRTLAAEWLAAAPDAVRFERDADGAVRIVAPAAAFVSVAGRGDWTVVAIGREPLGVDLELAGAELAEFARAAGLTPAAALRRWIAAEAFAKASGTPLDAALDAAARVGPLRRRLAGFRLSYAAFDGGMAAAASRA